MMTNRKVLIQLMALAAIVTALGTSAAWAQVEWTAELLPDYEQDAEDWWYNHPFNQEGPNYDMTPPRPTNTVTLSSGQSIGSAIGSGNITIYLNSGTYSNFGITDKDNVHIIANSGASINASHTYLNACSEAQSYHDFNLCFQQRDPACLSCYNDPLRNIYMKNLTFNGGGGRNAHTLQVVRGVVYENCTFQGFGYVAEHHPGMVIGHERLENVWFVNTHFVGTQYNGFYLDGCHGGGAVYCEFESTCYRGMLFLTNDDFSEDFNNNDLWEPEEMRNAQFNCIVGNTFDGVPINCIDFNQGRRMMVKDNVQLGSCQKFIYSTDRCSQRYHNLFYDGFGNCVFDNAINECDYFYEVNSRHENCIQSGDCWNYGKLGRFRVRGNTVNTLTSGSDLVYDHGATFYDPMIIEGNRVNGSGTADTNYVNQAPTVNMTWPSDSDTLAVAHDHVVQVSASDSDGSINRVVLLADSQIVDTDTSSPYELTWLHDDIIHGDHSLIARAYDNDGRTSYHEITVTIADTVDTNTVTAPSLPITFSGDPIGTQKSRSVTLDLTGATAATLIIDGFDIDDDTEATMYINGTQLDIPCYAIEDGGPHTDSRDLPLNLLNDGSNTITFEFSNNPGGTTGYRVEGLDIAVGYGGGNRVAMPAFSPDGGNFECSTDVTMTCGTPGAEIWYTTDGSTPSQGGGTSTQYTTAINLTADTTLKAQAYYSGMDDSLVKSASYTIVSSRSVDVDGNGQIELADVSLMAGDWLLSGDFDSDVNCDSNVDLIDFYALSEAWGAEAGNTYQQDSGTQGIVCIEAEHFSLKTARGGDPDDWTLVTSPTGYTGEGNMHVLPDDGDQVNTGYDTAAPQLDFEVNFVKTGTHYLWVRGSGPDSSGDSCHMGLDGSAVSSAEYIDLEETTGTLEWGGGTSKTLDITSTGLHTVNLWMREDGVVVDKIVLTTDAGYVPSGTGPSESPRN